LVGFQWLVTAILTVHFGYLIYLVLGGFLAWRWPVAIWPHLASAVWGGLILTNLVGCPLTMAEGWARQRAGDGAVEGGFIDRYVTGVIYPGQYVNEVRLAVAVVVAVAWSGAYLRWRSRRLSGRREAAASAGAAGSGLDTSVKAEPKAGDNRSAPLPCDPWLAVPLRQAGVVVPRVRAPR
jgi:hypothetical protein